MWGGGGQGGCDLRIKFLGKFTKKKIWVGGGDRGGGGGGGWGWVGWVGWGGVRVDVNEELKIL